MYIRVFMVQQFIDSLEMGNENKVLLSVDNYM